MIWTVTFSPSLDYALEVDGLEPGVHIARRADLRPGGKGVNVALVAKALGAEAAALGFTAGFTGREIVRALREAGLRTDFLPAKGRCRINVKLLAGQETQVNAPGVEIGPGQTLSGFVKKTVPGLPVCAVETAAEVEALPETLEQLIKEDA